MAEARQMHGIAAQAAPPKPSEDSSDPAVIKAKQRAARMDARRMAAIVGGMMESPEVRTWMYRLLENTRAFMPNDFPLGAPVDPWQLTRNAAHREIAQFLTADIMAACPDLYVTMLRENAG